MRFKVGDQWFDCKKGQPLMVELSREDKDLIARMAPEANRYAQFVEDEPMTVEERQAWMDVGASKRV